MQNGRAVKEKAIELLQGKVSRVLGWKKGEFEYDMTPAVFDSKEAIEADFVYDDFCGANLSKYLISESKKEGKIAVFLKPCDTYSMVQLLSEHKIDRDNVHVVGVPCDGKIDIEKVKENCKGAILGVESKDGKVTVTTPKAEQSIEKAKVLEERCESCKSKKHVIYDEIIGDEGDIEDSQRFDEVARLEAMTPDERFEFWRNELSKCIRCNACRNACPACTCEKCIFDNPASGVENKAAADSFEENMFHIIRAYHVAGRCTDCGECSRVCPQNIPLHLLNRKFIKDINELYGEYQAGAEQGSRSPLVDYKEEDAEPSVVYERGE